MRNGKNKQINLLCEATQLRKCYDMPYAIIFSEITQMRKDSNLPFVCFSTQTRPIPLSHITTRRNTR
jgi:hypothetical protein